MKKEKLRRLKPRVKMLTDFYTWDVETTKLTAKSKYFIFGVIYGKNFTKIINSVEDFKTEFLDPRYKGKKIFAHNAGAFDIPVIWGDVYQLDNYALYNGSRFISATNGNCIFADSINVYVGASIAKLGDYLGIEKTFTKEDYKKGIQNLPKHKQIQGCTQDCIILYEALIRFFESAGDIKITQAGLSLTYFRRYHQAFDIDYNKFTNDFFLSYFGGRTEAFKLGKTTSRVIDVNSMYPYWMKHCVFPNPRTLKKTLKCSKSKLQFLLSNFEGVVELSVFHKSHYFGFLPLKKDKKLLFPIGHYRGIWNFNEIRFALDYKVIEIKDIHWVTWGDKMESPFKSYVDAAFDMKHQAEIDGDELERDKAKRFSNSLYGKFGQRIKDEQYYCENIENHLDDIFKYQKEGRLVKIITFGFHRKDCRIVIKKLEAENVSNSIPSFASYITSAARIHLLKQLIEFYDTKQIPVYCDTDSIFYEGDNTLHSTDLGEWKTEDKIITEIRGLKNYSGWVLKDGIKIEFDNIKGIPKSYLDADGKRHKVSKGADGVYRYMSMVKTKESIIRGIDAGIMIHRHKKLTGKYTKRIILKNQKDTKPIEL